MSYILAVVNQKGGVAKTTSVVSLGGAMALDGQDVLLVDLDPQADLTLALGVNPGQIRGSVADVLLNSDSLISVRRETPIAGLDLIPSNHEMELAERFLPIRHNYENILRTVLETHLPANAYDYVILDCPPSLGAVTLNALNAANMVIIPTQPEYFSAHALRNVVMAIRKVRSQSNPNLIFRILITLHDRRNRIHRELSEQLRSSFGDGVLQTVIDLDTKLRESSIAGLPITHFINKTRGSQQYQALAQELIQHVQKTVIRPAQNAA
jgi:chromosome partitioning protein